MEVSPVWLIFISSCKNQPPSKLIRFLLWILDVFLTEIDHMMPQNYVITLFRIRMELTCPSDWPLPVSLKELQTLETSGIGGLQFRNNISSSSSWQSWTPKSYCNWTLGAMIVIINSCCDLKVLLFQKFLFKIKKNGEYQRKTYLHNLFLMNLELYFSLLSCMWRHIENFSVVVVTYSR